MEFLVIALMVAVAYLVGFVTSYVAYRFFFSPSLDLKTFRGLCRGCALTGTILAILAFLIAYLANWTDFLALALPFSLLLGVFGGHDLAIGLVLRRRSQRENVGKDTPE